MKGFILKTVLISIPVVIIALVMEAALRRIPNDYEYKKSYLDKNAEKIETLILGSSQEYYGLDPKYFSGNAFNACHVSQGYDMDYAIFKKYITRLNALKTVIIPLSYSSITMDLKQSPEVWRYKNYSIYYDINRWDPAHCSELLAMKSSINLKRLWSYYIDNKSEKYCSELGWGKNYKRTQNGLADSYTVTKERAAVNISRHTINDSLLLQNIVNGNVAIIQNIIDIAAKKGVRVILLAPPVTNAYKALRSEHQIEILKVTANRIVKDNKYCTYLDMSDFPMFTDGDFSDADHLNDVGAKKLSAIVNGWK
jgi:hypothetical protein